MQVGEIESDSVHPLWWAQHLQPITGSTRVYLGNVGGGNFSPYPDPATCHEACSILEGFPLPAARVVWERRVPSSSHQTPCEHQYWPIYPMPKVVPAWPDLCAVGLLFFLPTFLGPPCVHPFQPAL